MVMSGIITRGTGHARHTIALNGTRVGTNVHLTFAIHQQLTYKNMLNSVHNCESRSRMNYQGNIAVHVRIRNILLMALTIVVSCCIVYPSCTSINRVEIK